MSPIHTARQLMETQRGQELDKFTQEMERRRKIE
jgi:hypothetical protein